MGDKMNPENYKCETKLEYLTELSNSICNRLDKNETEYIHHRFCTICDKKTLGIVEMDKHFKEKHKGDYVI